MSKFWRPSSSVLEAGVRGLTLDDVGEETKATSSRLDYDREKTDPLVVPIYHAATYKIDSVDDYLEILNSQGYIYSRLGNPTCEQAECTMKALEGAAGSLTFSSGMAAVTTAIMAVCKAGDHIVAQNPIYSGTHKFLSKFAPLYGLEFTWVPAGCDVSEYEKAVKSNTKLLIGETPCNPKISVLDMEAFGALGARLDGVYTMVDATYATPYLLKPIKYGVDMVCHSATKYLGGHSDLIAGMISTRTEELWTICNIWRTTVGNTLSPFDAHLLFRGMKTLHVRVERHCENAMKVATFLSEHAKVKAVHYPGLSSHPGHQVAAKQMKGYGGMVAFEMNGYDGARTVVENLRVIQLAVSLGGVESLIEHAASMTHGPMIMSDAERQEAGISDGLIRLSVGIENGEDLVADLQQALDKVTS